MSKTKKDEEVQIDPKEILGKFMKEHKDETYNHFDDIDYKISTGSLNLDLAIGGFVPGVHRLIGPASSGKTSEALEVTRNFFNTFENSRAIYVKTEGRLSQNIRDRSGLKFYKDWEQWENHSVFVFECNVYETILDMMRKLIGKTPSKIRYIFIIDSADSVNLRADLDKTIDEANKVAGAPLLTKQFLQKLSLGMTKFGHMSFFIGQVSAGIKINAYAPSDHRQVGGSGGNAVQHFANEVLEYLDRYPGDSILTDPDAKPDELKNPIIGHICKIQIKKTDNEKRFVTVKIPIKYGQTGGKSVWREREIVDQLLMWNLLEKNGAWFKFSPNIKEDLQKIGVEVPETIQGLNNIYKYLEENQTATNFLFDLFKKRISQR